MTDLETLANKLKEWRDKHPKGPYPKHIWNEIKLLAEQHPIFTLAQTLGISATYLQQKLRKNPESLILAPVKVTSFPAPISIEFIDRHCRPMVVHFQADYDQLTRMILTLSNDPR